MQLSERIEISSIPTTLTNRKKNQVYLDQLYTELLNVHNDSICSLLSKYDSERGTVYNFTIDRNTLSLNHDNNVSFIVQYDIYYYMGCKDQNYTKEDECMEITLITNYGESLLIGEDRPERDPDDF